MRVPAVRRSRVQTLIVPTLASLVILVLVGLPIAVYLDLRDIAQDAMRTQAVSLDHIVTGIRGFYADDVVRRVLANHGHATVTNHYLDRPGGIPIPAKFSLELGQVIGDRQASIGYRFISHYPFRGTKAHSFNDFENQALATLEKNPNETPPSMISWHGANGEVRYVTPIIMEASCVACHNTHPDSPKRDWKVGDVRGIQELIVTQALAYNLKDFWDLLIFFAVAVVLGTVAIVLQLRQAKEIRAARDFLASISEKISKYLSPQIYRSIFSGKTDSSIATKRKKLTIFFSDIKDFTSTSEQLQPEELTLLLNEYFTEMSAIALKHGGTIDKFVGDAILVFFGDPESRGEAQDAHACVEMALEMQHRLRALNAQWRARGVERPFNVRMGINTGFCNVGNFGSIERMDYTIIGAEANLAARLQSVAEPGTVVVSYETYALVRDIVSAQALEPIHVKGISREVIPYRIESRDVTKSSVVSEHSDGIDFYLDVDAVGDPARVRSVLLSALDALERNQT